MAARDDALLHKLLCAVDARETEDVASVSDFTAQICADAHVRPDATWTVADLVACVWNRRSENKAKAPKAEDQDHPRAHQARLQQITPVVSQVLKRGLLSDTSPAIDLFNLDLFQARCEELIAAFEAQLPQDRTAPRRPKIIHAAAVKAQPIRGILKCVQRYPEMGAECASYPEAKHALSLGFQPHHVVFDTPCKSRHELMEILESGCYVNLDNLEEIQTLAKILEHRPTLDLQNQVGLRLNPVVGGGAIACTSTATAGSKFGLVLTPETEPALLELFAKHRWLQGVHCHVGSQGCALEQLVAGVRRTVDFALKVNTCRQQIGTLDIGGGLPTRYDGHTREPFAYRAYADALRHHVPEMFDGRHFHTILTEFGRSLFVKSGTTLSTVEAVKTSPGQVRTAVVHVGANQFLRTAYLPNQWPHALSVYRRQNDEPSKALVPQNVCGPMCFSGDFLAKNRPLPRMAPGDIVVIHDTGGYTTAMYSKYNSRRASAMYAYRYCPDTHDWTFTELKARETCDETLAFWGHEVPPVVP